MQRYELKTNLSEKSKLKEIIEQITKQCKVLGGESVVVRHSETLESVVCRFPEPVEITRADFKEVEGEGGEFYIETEKGYHGVVVKTGDIRARVEAMGVTGDAIYDNAGYRLVGGRQEQIRHFMVIPKGKRKTIKKTKEIRYTVSPNLVQIYF